MIRRMFRLSSIVILFVMLLNSGAAAYSPPDSVKNPVIWNLDGLGFDNESANNSTSMTPQMESPASLTEDEEPRQHYWQIETIDDSNNVGQYSSLNLSFGSTPKISYFDADSGHLKYAEKLSDSWRIKTIDTSTNVGKYTGLAFNSVDDAYIAYYDYENDGLKLSRYTTDGSIATQYIDGEDPAYKVGQYASLDNSYDYMHVSYFDETNGDLVHAVRDFSGMNFYTETIDHEGIVGKYTSIAVENDDFVHISYYDESWENLKYAYKDGEGWHVQDIDGAGAGFGFRGKYTSIVLDSESNPHISYISSGYRDEDYALRSAKYVGSDGNCGPLDTWECLSIDYLGVNSRFTSLGLDKNGNPHIVYYDQATKELKHAYNDGTEGNCVPNTDWHCEVIDYTGEGEIWPSLAIDTKDMLHISYYDPVYKNLKYAYMSDEFPQLVGDTSCAWGDSDCNQCVNDVEASFDRLRDHGDILGFHIGDHPDSEWNYFPEWNKHWQGIQRLAAGDGQYMVVTHDDAVDDQGEGWSTFAVVEMASRTDGGYRYRSNRLQPNVDFNNTPPPP